VYIGLVGIESLPMPKSKDLNVIKMKITMKITLSLFALAVMICACTSTAERQAYEQRLAFYRTKTELVIKQACTNDVTGLTQIVQININEAAKDVSKWSADATVNFVDKTGGTKQEKVHYNFTNTGDDLNCFRKY
jgi:hypothetical protein